MSDAAVIDRFLIAIFDSDKEKTPADTMLHGNAEMPLNHLGYIVHYHDVRQGLPDLDTLDGVVAVISMLTYDLNNPADYFRWLKMASDKGLRVIIMGSFGGPLTPAALRSLDPVLQRMGLELTGGYVSDTLSSRSVVEDRALIGYEATVDPLPAPHVVVHRAGTAANVALEYETETVSGRVRSVLAATGPGGGYVASGYFLHFGNDGDSKRWIVDPFLFFRRALATRPFPVPDTTTLAGRRLYFSHVDGEGWNNPSLADNHRDKAALAARVMLDALIRPYPDLPVTVGFVQSAGDDRLAGGKAARQVARDIFALPQVEVASHTATQPLVWGFFEHYRREDELKLVSGDDAGFGERLRRLVGLGPDEAERMKRTHVAGNNNLPRVYVQAPYDTHEEVIGALQKVESLAPRGKAAALYQWSGDARPYEAAVKASREAGVRNMNGGSTRFDALFPSIAYIAPLARQVGAERQIYAVGGDENLYTDFWTRHFYGQRAVIATFQRTGNPVRLRGMNLHYHAYSAERTASVAALRAVLDEVRGQAVIPIEASSYAAIADGFFSTRIRQVGALEWQVDNRDGLNTVRFDDMTSFDADIAASAGVLGTTRHGGSLYVALDPSTRQADIRLRKVADPYPQRGSAKDMNEAGLSESRWRIWDLTRTACGMAFSTRGYGIGEFAWYGLPARRAVRVSARRERTVLADTIVQSRDDGSLSFTLPIDGIAPMTVDVNCVPQGRSQ